MRSRKTSECHFPPLRLIVIGLACATIVDAAPEVACKKKVSLEESPSENQYAVHEATTTEPLETVTTDSSSRNLKLTSPIDAEADPRNCTSAFRPSAHLGEIEEEPKARTNPFNNVQPMRFESNLDRQHERRQHVQDTYQGDTSLLDEATRSSRIKFQDDSGSSIHHPFDVQQTVTESTGPQVEEATVGHVYAEQTYLQNAGGKPEVQDHRFTAAYINPPKSPYVIDYYTGSNQNAYQPMSQETTFEIKKPESDGVLVVKQESTYTRKQKFPYPFYQPGNENHMQFADETHYSTHPQMRSQISWKKIIHLIGTFLPLGLLLATLTPNFVRITNTTTQPAIVLSKLRAIDLPLEHKQARLLDDQSAACEDRSICELILAGGEPQTNILQNILWNLATRIPDDVAKKNGLREVFGAVKKKDCTIISC